MKNNPTIPKGYKLTKIGVLPVEWEVVKLDQVYSFKNGINASKEDYGFGTKFINVSEIFKNDIIQASDIPGEVNISQSKLEGSLIENGDILWNRTSETFDEIAYSAIYKGDEKVTFGGFVIRGKQLSNKIIPGYSIYAFKTDSFREQAIRRAQGAVRANIGQKDLGAIQIPLPPLPQQQKIANILTTWDDAIRLQTQLINAKKKQKRGLMQRLLTGEVRLAGFEGGWKSRKMGDVFQRIRAKATSNNAPAYTISSTRGFVTQKEKFNRVIAGSSLSKYVHLDQLDFSYNKGNSKTYPYGCIFLFEDDAGLVPFVYISFKAKANIDHYFYKHYFEFGGLERQLRGIISSGARGEVLLNVNPDSFFKLKVHLPPLPEQRAIANILTTFDREITLLETRLTELREQKRGLMQRLLTGQVRVDVTD